MGKKDFSTAEAEIFVTVCRRRKLCTGGKKDRYDQDKLFMKNCPDFRAFQIFTSIVCFPNLYLDFFPEEAFNWQLHRIREIYCTPGENFEREYPYCTTADIDHFVQSM